MKQHINIILITLVMFFTMSNFTLKADTNDNVQYYKAYQYTQKMSYESDFDDWTTVNIPIYIQFDN